MSIYSILQPVFGDNLYPVIHPDSDGTDIEDLYAVYMTVAGTVLTTLKNDDDLTRPRTQISIYGINFLDVEIKEKAVVAAMKAANVVYNQAVKDGLEPLAVTGSLPNKRIGCSIDGFEKDTRRFVKHMEYYCWVRS